MAALCIGTEARAGEVDVLVNKLVEKGILSPADAQIVLDETKVQVSKELAHGESVSVPEWTQRIKWGGDVRFRTNVLWGKPDNNQKIGTPSSNSPLGDGTTPPNSKDIRKQEIRNRIRGRFYMEGKVNDFTYAGVRFAGGGANPRSTNDTLGAYDSKAFVMFDQYYMRFEAPSEMVRDYGCYFNDLKLWAGRFANPFEYSCITWDPDINPSGVALQYVSPDINMGGAPEFNAYANVGFFWLDEAANYNTDPLLFGYQVGVKTAEFGPLNSVLNISTALYDFGNLRNKTPVNSAMTNTRVWNGDTGSANPAIGTYRYEYNVFDLLVQLDNAKFMGCPFGSGLYSDYIYNPAAGTKWNSGYLLGGYVGKKKIKDVRDWKARAEYRRIERDAIPDFMPDDDFYGFGTYISPLEVPGVNGLPAGGGTNGQGINLAFEYQLFKNTALVVNYFHSTPIESEDKTCPFDNFMCDVITKF